MKWQGAFLSSGAGLRCQGGVQPGGTEPQYQGLWAAAAGGWTAVSGMMASNASALDRMAEAPFRRFHIGVEAGGDAAGRSEEHTSELQSLMRISYAVFCLKKKKK